MKIQFGALLVATLVLTGCESPPKTAAADGQPVVASTTVAKKKCDATTGSRMNDCRDQGAPEVQGVSGDDYRRSASTGSNSAAQVQPF